MPMDGDARLYVQRLDGTAPRPLQCVGWRCLGPLPSADGQKLLVQLRPETMTTTSQGFWLGVVDLATGNCSRTAGPFRSVAGFWIEAPGKLIYSAPVFPATARQTRIVDLRSGSSRILTGGSALTTLPVPAPSGRYLAGFVIHGASRRAVVVPSIGGQPACEAAEVSTVVTRPMWNPTSECVAFGNGTEIVVMSVGAEAIHIRLPGLDRYAQSVLAGWSPDGTVAYVFAEGIGGAGRIYTYSRETRSTDLVATVQSPRGVRTGPMSGASLSPDGKLLLCRFFNDVDVGMTWSVLDLASKRIIPLKWADRRELVWLPIPHDAPVYPETSR